MPAVKGLILAAVMCAASAIVGNAALADTTRVFGVWTATCWTKDDRCAAETDAIVRTPYRVTLSAARDNASGANWEAGLRLRRVRLARGAAITLRADGGAKTFGANGYVSAHGGGTVRFTGKEEAAALIRGWIAADRATVSFQARRRGQVSRDFLVNGLGEALAWINRQQGRSTSVTAQLAPAAEPETTKPPARPAARADKGEQAEPPRAAEKKRTVVAANEATKKSGTKADVPPAAAPAGKSGDGGRPQAPAQRQSDGANKPRQAAAPDTVPAALIAQHQRKSECETFGAGTLKGLMAKRAPLSDSKTLYMVPCFASNGAVASRLYVTRGDNLETVRTLYFANYSHSLGWYGSDTLIDAAYDEESAILTAGGTGRGKGCGNAARYRWDGFDFRLLEYRASDDCDGPEDPGQWPLVYEADPDKS